MLLTEIFKNIKNLSESFIMLMEVRLDVIFDKFGQKLNDRFHHDNKIPEQLKKLGHGNIAKNLIDHFSSIDPTRRKIYVQWTVSRYLDGEILGNIEKLRETLPLFDKVKPKLEKSDINAYRKIDELNKVLAPFVTGEITHLSGKEIKKGYRENVDTIMNTPNFKVVVPLSHKAACIWGKGTKWCTASIDTAEDYLDYSAKGPLFTILTKREGDRPRKFQLHYENGEFRDETDNSISEKDINYLSTFPEYKKFLNMLIKKHYGEHL